MKIILKSLLLFVFFGMFYFIVESIAKGEIAHQSIYLLGGFIAVIISIVNRYIPWRTPLILQSALGMTIAAAVACAAGAITNLWLGLNLWHYNVLAFCMGQCSLVYCAIWFVLSTLCIIADDYINWKWISKEQPVYY